MGGRSGAQFSGGRRSIITFVSQTTDPTASTLIVLIPWLMSIVWVYRDARSRARAGHPVRLVAGWFQVTSADAWTGGCVVLWIAFFPMYLVARYRSS